MSHLFRCGLVAAGLVTAFAAGFYLKPVPAVPTIAARPAPAPVILPPIHDPEVKPATALGPPQAPRLDPPDPLDAAGMAMIGKAMGLKTTVLDKTAPVPAVLADARKPAAPDLPRIDLPVPMGEPMPRLDPPPVPMIPTIPDYPPTPPAARPPTSRPLFKTRAVALDFEVTKSGPSKVMSVELWTTRDGGATWAKTDRMAGCVSPFRTRLGSDGDYGFRLVFESEAGLRTPVPKAGDQPDLRLELDTTPPHIADLSISPAGGARDKVRIQWRMSDAHQDPAGVRIEYSADGRGWHPAALDPPGAHNPRGADFRAWTAVWAVPPGLPHRVMLRVTARDRAGNEATVELPQPVSIDLVPPEGKVTGVRSTEAEVGPAPREVEAATGPTRPLPEALRTLLPALLASPSIFPPVAWARTANEPEARLCWSVETARRFVATPVVEPEPVERFVRRDPFVIPASGDPEPVAADLFMSVTKAPGARWAYRKSFEETRLFRQRLELGARIAPVWPGGHSLINLLGDPDWKPTTATPESCRWEYDPVPVNYWGNTPLGLLIRF